MLFYKHFNFTRLLLFIFILSNLKVSAQDPEPLGNVFVDDQGIMRWEVSNTEVQGFGVNYSVPFAHAYRSAQRMGVDVKQAIDNDVYHFKRLGFDLYRLHVWDTEISDTLGNLLNNEHLDAFDYLLKTLKDHKINYVITPIAFWGNGWPEPDEETPGFSHKYGKGDCLYNEDAIKAQQNYLFQFLNHVNPYTGVAYKDDPNVIAFEVSNEPHHRGETTKVTEFVKSMTDTMRRTGTKKPIFYNMSHAVHFMDAYFKGGVQGGTFQWYPTGLGYQRELPGNLLPNVNDYNMPFDTIFKTFKGAKLVYEFDAADVGRSYIYPAMARSFRSAGIQIATHFAYDPTYLAAYNTEYNTHYMNLAYTPQKALSLKISSEVFHEIPMNSEFGIYPQNTTFGKFKVDYFNDLAEYNTETKFFYTNSTNSILTNEDTLEEIAGYGNSIIVKYDGTGAYFLDKIADHIWRLEVMPDAVWVQDPFGRNSPNKTVGVIKWETHKMMIDLKDLGSDFKIEPINDGNDFVPETRDGSFSIRPGTYIISKKGSVRSWSATNTFKTYELKNFSAPKSTVDKAWLKHDPVIETTSNSPLTLKIQYVAPSSPDQIQIIGYNGSERIRMDMKKEEGYNYKAIIPIEKVQEGFINYNIVVKTNNEYVTHPAGHEGQPFDWDFYDRSTYKIKVVPKANPILLFNANDDTYKLVRQWRNTFRLMPTENPDEVEYQMNIEKLFIPDNENLEAEPIYDYSFKHFILDKIVGRKKDLSLKNHLVFYGRSLNNKPCKTQIAFVLNDGTAYGKIITIEPETKEYKISINDLQPVKTVTLPRPYPSFLPYYLKHDIIEEFEINRIESLQFSIGPEISIEDRAESHGIAMIKLWLE